MPRERYLRYLSESIAEEAVRCIPGAVDSAGAGAALSLRAYLGGSGDQLPLAAEVHLPALHTARAAATDAFVESRGRDYFRDEAMSFIIGAFDEVIGDAERAGDAPGSGVRYRVAAPNIQHIQAVTRTRGIAADTARYAFRALGLLHALAGDALSAMARRGTRDEQLAGRYAARAAYRNAAAARTRSERL